MAQKYDGGDKSPPAVKVSTVVMHKLVNSITQITPRKTNSSNSKINQREF